ncbi:hypothetical protein MARI_28410 [Marinobacter sp. JH2]|nr:hypothetical protein MARI_01510 [Marinobacter sp. JH2]QBM17662.1 hypothetical protein MARI_17830 [Marinobacter sp. JH2]QBM18699.1 hypothetical protein MARI_28410 [Marinobacter sp. JH2]
MRPETPREQGYECLNTEIAGLRSIKGKQSGNGKLLGELTG